SAYRMAADPAIVVAPRFGVREQVESQFAFAEAVGAGLPRDPSGHKAPPTIKLTHYRRVRWLAKRLKNRSVGHVHVASFSRLCASGPADPFGSSRHLPLRLQRRHARG